jgi:hypothetical protein
MKRGTRQSLSTAGAAPKAPSVLGIGDELGGMEPRATLDSRWTLRAAERVSLGDRSVRLVVAALALVLALSLLLGCTAAILDTGPRPLSRLTIHNQHPDGYFLRANWIEGMEQTSRIPMGDPLYISGSIAGAFPHHVEILDRDCNVLARLTDQPWDTQALVTMSELGMTMQPISSVAHPYDVAEVVKKCRTKPDLP